MPKVTIRDLPLNGKRVLVRVDYNVPLQEKEGKQVITNDTRIRETLPTIKYPRRAGRADAPLRASRRPKGKRDPMQSLALPRRSFPSCSAGP